MQMRFAADSRTLTCVFPARVDASNVGPMSKAFTAQLAAITGQGGALTVAAQAQAHAADTQPLRIVFDLSALTYASSLFLRLCVIAAKRAGRENFAITGASTAIADLLKLSGLDQAATIEVAAHAEPVFAPPAAFAARARISAEEYAALYEESISQPEQFWARMAQENLQWQQPWTKVLDWKSPRVRWFSGGTLNAAANCLDRHLATPVADKVAIIWEGEPDSDGKEVRRITYRELHAQVSRFANVLKAQGVRQGDRVLIYLPMVPEAAIAMLACARLGAIHSVVFGGFSAQAIADRVSDCAASVIVTADGGYRRGKIVPLKAAVDEAFALKDERGEQLCDSVEKVIVLRRTGAAIPMQAGRDLWWHEEEARVTDDCPAVPVESETPLFILYTSGSTGKPKGIFHSTAGYLLGATLSARCYFDLQPDDIYFCTADIGWITGHTYVVYGLLSNGATILLYEGAPNWPEPDRFWSIIARHKATILYTAPTAIRAFMQWGDQWPAKHDLSSLRLLGTVGEPINPEAWLWYRKHIGADRCPVVDTWWQTETGAIMISTMPGAMAMKPGSAGKPFFGVLPEVVDDKGEKVPVGTGGKLVIRQPWPSMLRGVWGDHERYEWTYWTEVEGCYFTGDGARCDTDGYFSIMGRIDDVLNVSGHRIGTAEVESSLVGSKLVTEAAVVGRPDDSKGSAIVAFVTAKDGIPHDDALREKLRRHVAEEIGPVAKPDEIRFAQALPKTRSGKIMRRLLKQIAAGTEVTGDTTTLEDFNVLAKLTSGEG